MELTRLYKINHKNKYLHISILIMFLVLSSIFFVYFINNDLKEFTDVLMLNTLLIFYLTFIFWINVDIRVKIFSTVVFIIKIIMLFFYVNNYDFIIFPDSHAYIRNLNLIIHSGNFSFENLVSITGTLHVGHYYYMLIPYILFGSAKAIIFLNTLLTSISIILMFKVINVLFGKRVGVFTLIFSSFSMNLVIMGGLILKDPLVIFLGALILYLLIVKKSPVFITLALSVLMFTVRIYAGFSFLMTIVIYTLINSTLSKRKKTLSFFLMTTFIFIIIILPASQNYLNLSTSYLTQNLNIAAISSTISSLSKFYFAPLPWNLLITIGPYKFLMLDSILMLFLSFSLFMFIIKFFSDKQLRNKVILFLIPILIHAVVLGIEYDGDSIRQRSGVFILLISLMGIGLFYKKKRQ